jgi:hypothetical protein
MILSDLIRLVRRAVVRNIVDDGSGGGGGATGAPATPAAAPAEPAAPAASAPAAPEPPKTMLEAISQGLEQSGQPRDELGRFAAKQAAEAAAAAAAAAGAPATAQAAPGAAGAPGGAPGAAAAAAAAAGQPPGAQQPEDELAMPEGLTPRAQERFQKLANTVREQKEVLEQREQQIGYLRETFQEHGIRQDQFEQAASVIGMMNRGDFAGAQRVLMEQLQQLAVLSGQPVGQIDPLANFPDLRQAVEGLQMTEEYALEVARSRAQQHARQQHQQQQDEQRQTQQQSQQAVQTATKAVDDFCRRMQGTDMDYSLIEAQLLPELQNLLAGVPPAMWAKTVETQYRLLKNAASKFKAAAPAAAPATVLRATGQGSPAAAPKSMHEAMWGTPAP